MQVGLGRTREYCASNQMHIRSRRSTTRKSWMVSVGRSTFSVGVAGWLVGLCRTDGAASSQEAFQLVDEAFVVGGEALVEACAQALVFDDAAFFCGEA